VPSGALINDVTALGFSESSREVTLYVEGVRVSAGQLVPITLTVTADDGYSDDDLVTVVVVSNKLVIGIDGTGSEAWLAKTNAAGNLFNHRATLEGTRWNSHVRNLVVDSDPFAMTIYKPGPAEGLGGDSDNIYTAALEEANNQIDDAGGGTKVAIVGWSRGGMIAIGLANQLSNPLLAGALPRTVEYVGLYDPVDMADTIDPAWNVVDAKVNALTIVGPQSDAIPHFNVDYVGTAGFRREALQDTGQWRITHAGDVYVRRRFLNASHGAIGGTPGYNKRNLDPPQGQYDYTIDREESIRADRYIRDRAREAGFDFLPNRADPWYAFPLTRPPGNLRG